MSRQWRRVGWQQMEMIVPADWYLSKIGAERSAGDLWLADAEMPRLQLKWLDAKNQKSVDPEATLDRYLKELERQAKKRKQPFELERDVKILSRAGRDISSYEGFRWTAEIQSYGAIWYSRGAERVTLVQVNAPLDEPEFKATARRILNNITDITDAEEDLWTAFDLVCRIPREWQLLSQVMETGHTELKFGRQKDTLTIARYGLAAIALQRAGDLGDWAHSTRYKEWITYQLDRDESDWQGHPAVTFRGRKRNVMERLREKTYNFVRQPYPIHLAARTWHCEEANCLFIVEHLRNVTSEDQLDAICETIPCAPELLPPPKS